jgi:hypothetical protein
VAQTIDQIEAHIDRTREQLGADFRELEDKVSTATNWRAHYERAPMMFVGAAVVGGVLLGSMASRKRRPRRMPMLAARSPMVGSESYAPSRPASHARQYVNNLAGALVSLGLARLTSYIDQQLPGFDEHYRRAEHGE